MFSTAPQGGFSDELIGLDLAHRRELRDLTAEAQGVVDAQDRRIVALQRELDSTRGRLAASQQTVAGLKAERGARNMSMIMQSLRRRQH